MAVKRSRTSPSENSRRAPPSPAMSRRSAPVSVSFGSQRSQPAALRKKAFEGWRAAIEAKDILVFVVPRLKMKEMRRTALAETTLPVILVNGKDRGNGHVFTLLYEFCCMSSATWRGAPGL